MDGIVKAIENSGAVKLYIGNIMTQPGETEGYSVSDHIRELFRHSSSRLFDMCLVNSTMPHPDLIRRYAEDGASPIFTDTDKIKELGVEVFDTPLAECHKTLIRHNPELLAREIMTIFRKRAPTRIFRRKRNL